MGADLHGRFISQMVFFKWCFTFTFTCGLRNVCGDECAVLHMNPLPLQHRPKALSLNKGSASYNVDSGKTVLKEDLST